MRRLFARISATVCVSLLIMNVTGCFEENHPGTYYTFTGETIADYLSNRESYFSSFIEVLKKAGLWGEMRTYGEYTCLAPTNEAIEIFLKEKNLSSVSELTVKECDTIARTHIIANEFYLTDLIEGALPYPNMLDRYLIYTCDSTATAESNKVIYRINRSAIILERDDTLQNGAMHVVDRVIQPSNSFLPDVMKEDSTISLFYQALIATGLSDSLVKHIDPKYIEPGEDSCTTGYFREVTSSGEREFKLWPAKRYFKFTAFVETDEVYKAHGINNLEDLAAYAKKIYDDSYPSDAYQYDDDYTNRKNPLNRFVSYHLLPYGLNYNDMNFTDPQIVRNCIKPADIDMEEFYETLAPHTIMRISTPHYQGNTSPFINRKGPAKAVQVRGAMVMSPSQGFMDQTALNGQYHYIDDIISYSKETRENTLNTRIRISSGTLSPDLVNSGARTRPVGSNRIATCFKAGFLANFDYKEEVPVVFRNLAGTYNCYYGGELVMEGIYDVTMKLPPVPTGATYEIRLSYYANEGRGVSQIYLNDVPCGIPLDLRLTGDNPKVGWISDSELGDEESINAHDHAMHNRGLMKGIDSYQGYDIQRDRVNMLRSILATEYMEPEKDYYLRIRQVLDNDRTTFQTDNIEIVPKSVYQGLTPEDRH